MRYEPTPMMISRYESFADATAPKLKFTGLNLAGLTRRLRIDKRILRKVLSNKNFCQSD